MPELAMYSAAEHPGVCEHANWHFAAVREVIVLTSKRFGGRVRQQPFPRSVNGVFVAAATWAKIGTLSA